MNEDWKVVKLTGGETTEVVARGWGEGEIIENYCSVGMRLPLYKMM